MRRFLYGALRRGNNPPVLLGEEEKAERKLASPCEGIVKVAVILSLPLMRKVARLKAVTEGEKKKTKQRLMISLPQSFCFAKIQLYIPASLCTSVRKPLSGNFRYASSEGAQKVLYLVRGSRESSKPLPVCEWRCVWCDNIIHKPILGAKVSINFLLGWANHRLNQWFWLPHSKADTSLIYYSL